MSIQKFSGNYRMLDSGSVLAWSPEEGIDFLVEAEGLCFELHLRFLSIENAQQLIRPEVEGNVITLTCVNFDEPLGSGTSRPIELAETNGKKLFTSFWAYAPGNGAARKIDYTFYIEK